MARKSRFRKVWFFLKTVRIAVHSRMKVAEPATATLWRFLLHVYDIDSGLRFDFYSLKKKNTSAKPKHIFLPMGLPLTKHPFLPFGNIFIHSTRRSFLVKKKLTFLLWFVVRMAANKECLTFTNLLINNCLFFLRVLILIYRFIAWFTFPFRIANDLYTPPLFKSYSQTSPTLLFLFLGPLKINPSTV